MPDLTPVASQTNALVTNTRAFPRALQAEFLKTLADWGNVRAACKAVGVARATAYRMRRECLIFRELWDAALLHARPMVEDVLGDRALNGVEETVYYHGEEVATRTRYDSRLLLAHLGRLDRLERDRYVVDRAMGFDEQVAELGASPERNGVAPQSEGEPEDGFDPPYHSPQDGEGFPPLDSVSSVSNAGTQ